MRVIKYGTLEEIKNAARRHITELKRTAAKQNKDIVGCPSVVESIGTKFNVSQQKDGSLKIECGGIKNSEICPKCPIYRGAERA
jgi:hypothetical protein